MTEKSGSRGARRSFDSAATGVPVAELTYSLIMRRLFAATTARFSRHAYLLDNQNLRGVFTSANGLRNFRFRK